MCGRFVATTGPADLARLYDAQPQVPEEAFTPSWNIAPTRDVLAVLERLDTDSGEVSRQVRALRWGLVPSWSKTPSAAAKMINARSETAHVKPAFRSAFSKRRCIIPSTGYYEWRQAPGGPGGRPYKQPYFLAPADGTLLGMAGLYEFWKDSTRPEDDPLAWLVTCTVLTTEATDNAGRVHDRMPLTITAANQAVWLDPDLTDPDSVRDLLHTPSGAELTVTAVATTVNSVRNDGPELLTEVEDPLPV
ncbi:SOS response-associated peptidase [Kitasatospora sp. GP82]|uniref:SOS response-associated peptidase n=1 Tax=Kitasatospora sp. GP82 TaxID=3035089 RepID=UPI0024735E3D|nr:SOS response-associated peptidase [Kitasatospora sp. GP82]MDH6129930.1 putative SOS response-associated peptidase YedK [Kitasatospora sp. GP82]